MAFPLFIQKLFARSGGGQPKHDPSEKKRRDLKILLLQNQETDDTAHTFLQGVDASTHVAGFTLDNRPEIQREQPNHSYRVAFRRAIYDPVAFCTFPHPKQTASLEELAVQCDAIFLLFPANGEHDHLHRHLTTILRTIETSQEQKKSHIHPVFAMIYVHCEHVAGFHPAVSPSLLHPATSLQQDKDGTTGSLLPHLFTDAEDLHQAVLAHTIDPAWRRSLRFLLTTSTPLLQSLFHHVNFKAPHARDLLVRWDAERFHRLRLYAVGDLTTPLPLPTRIGYAAPLIDLLCVADRHFFWNHEGRVWRYLGGGLVVLWLLFLAVPVVHHTFSTTTQIKTIDQRAKALFDARHKPDAEYDENTKKKIHPYRDRFDALVCELKKSPLPLTRWTDLATRSMGGYARNQTTLHRFYCFMCNQQFRTPCKCCTP